LEGYAAPRHGADGRLLADRDLIVGARRFRLMLGSRIMADICAHITGTVWKIQVKEGDQVEEEQQVVILESMKMEMPVESPHAGRVAKIQVTEGQAVDEGDVLITLD
jgi:acetyl-CoA carboxylase biotin carboxyl carrier protein